MIFAYIKKVIYICIMAKDKRSQIIRFDEEDYEFMEDVKEASGISIQQFVSRAVKNEISRLKLEVEFQDLKNS